jgi:hypothetical protein
VSVRREREHSPFLVTVITKLKIDRGLALQDLVGGAYEVLETIELPKQTRVYLLDHLATCEYVSLLVLVAK